MADTAPPPPERQPTPIAHIGLILFIALALALLGSPWLQTPSWVQSLISFTEIILIFAAFIYSRNVFKNHNKTKKVKIFSDANESNTASSKQEYIHNESDLNIKEEANIESIYLGIHEKYGDFVDSLIRSELHSAIGLTQLCLDNEKNEAQRDYLMKALQSTEKVLRVLFNASDVSLLNNQNLELNNQIINLRKTVLNAAELMADKTAGQNIKISWKVSNDVPEHATGDQARIDQILANICINAVKSTEQGSIRITCEVSNATDEYIEIKFQVSDTGSGIPPFEAEIRHKNENTIIDGCLKPKSQPTNLLDLSETIVSHKLIHFMGGEIWFESNFGKGTLTHFTVKLKHHQSDELPAPTQSVLSEKPHLATCWQTDGASWGDVVLLVEDNPVNRLVTKEMLTRMGFSVLEAENGFDAIQVLKSKDVQVVLMDLQMPDMGGIEATRLIRSNAINSTVPIVALTSLATEKSRAEAMEAGMNGYLQKPVQNVELAQMLGSIISNLNRI